MVNIWKYWSRTAIEHFPLGHAVYLIFKKREITRTECFFLFQTLEMTVTINISCICFIFFYIFCTTFNSMSYEYYAQPSTYHINFLKNLKENKITQKNRETFPCVIFFTLLKFVLLEICELKFLKIRQTQ